MKKIQLQVARDKVLLISISVCLLALAVVPPSVQANEEGGVNLLFSPPIIELDLRKGQSYQQIVKLENRSNQVQTYYPIIQDFVAQGEEGAQEFLPAEESGSGAYSLKDWISISDEPLILGAGEKTAFVMTIDVPADAEPGGRYAALLFTTEPPDVSGITGVGVATKTGPIILGTVPGLVVEDATVKEFSVSRDYYEYPPVDFITRIENTGNVHIKPVGQIVITDMFGRTVDQIDVNEKLGNVLPNSVRRFDNRWSRSAFTVGKFTATLSLNFGRVEPHVLTSTLSFWVVPWKVILVGLLGLVILVLLLVKGVKAYNR